MANITTEERLKSQQIQKDVDRAKERQHALRREADARKAGPQGYRINAAWEDPRKSLVRLYVPDAIGKNAQLSVYFDHPDKHRRNLDLGWEPVIANGEQMRHGQDLMYKRPKEFSQSHIKHARDISDSRIKVMDAEMKQASTTGVSVQNDETTITKGKLQQNE